MSRKIQKEKRLPNEDAFSNESNKNKKSKECITKKKIWTREEDQMLIDLVKMQKVRKWSEISKKMAGRTGIQCYLRWNKLKLGLKRGQWTEYEDNLLIEWIKKKGPNNWEECGRFIHGRNGKQCREHWNNCLKPDLIKGEWTPEEDFLIMQFYEECNGRWKIMKELFEGRTENSIKNRFFSELRKIASKYLTIKERKGCSKINLGELKKYLKEGISEKKAEFLRDNKMTEEELNNYINEKKSIIKRYTTEENDSCGKNINTNIETNENGEKKDNSLCIKRNRTEEEKKEEKSEEEKEEKIKINIENEKDNNILRIECDDQDLEELKNKSINLDENIENNICNISDNSTSTYDNKDISTIINDNKDINNNNDLSNGDNNYLLFTEYDPMNDLNDSFENLDYHYKPSYTFIDNCGFLQSDYNKDININNLNNSFEEKKDLFENESNISLFEEFQ